MSSPGLAYGRLYVQLYQAGIRLGDFRGAGCPGVMDGPTNGMCGSADATDFNWGARGTWWPADDSPNEVS